MTNVGNGRNTTFCAQRSHLSSNPLKVYVRIRPAAVKSVPGAGDDELFVQAASDVELNMYPPNKDRRWVYVMRFCFEDWVSALGEPALSTCMHMANC